MHNFKLVFFKVIIFCLIFFIISYGLSFALVPKGNYSRMILNEMHADKNNLDLVFIGASLSERDIDPYIVSDKLKLKAFDYGFSQQSFIGTYYALKELFDYQKPKTVVLTMDEDTAQDIDEKSLVYISVAPYMKSFFNKAEYYFASSSDGSYLDRIFPWRGYVVKNMLDLINNVKGKLDKSYEDYPRSGDIDAVKNNKNGYVGNGYVRFDPNDKDGKLGYDNIKLYSYKMKVSEIPDKNIYYLKKMAELCKENNSKLILISPPMPTFKVLRVTNYFDFDDNVAKAAKDLGIEYYNFNLIKPSIFKSENDYFADSDHLNSKGAAVFSNSLSEFLKKDENGEDLSKYFYDKKDYLESIKYISTAWFNWNKDGDNISFKANGFYGSSVTPLYQYVLTDTDTGKETVIRDYSTDPNFEFNPAGHSKYKIRLNAKVKGSADNDNIRYYEETIR